MNYPIVYDKFANEFTSFGLAVLEKAKNTKIRMKINGEFILSFILPRNDPKWKYVLSENFVKVAGQLFRIRTFDEIRDSTGKLTSNVQCEHVWYDANDCSFFPDFSMIGASPREILEAAFAGTRFTIGSVDASLANTDIELSKTNPAAIVNKLIENVGGELERDNYTISLKAKLGNNNGVSFRTGKNNVEIKKTTDSKDLCTRLYPYGDNDLDITSVNDNKAYIDSQYINNYDYIHTRYEDYKDIDDPEELMAAGQAEFSTEEKDGCDKPKVTIEATVIELKKLSGYPLETFGLGDTVRPIDEDLNIDYNARITEYEYYPYEPDRSNVVLANFKDNTGELLASLADSRNKLNSLTTAKGKVKVAWLENIISQLQTEIEEGLTKKVAMHDYGDVWVDNIENPTKAMAIVDGKFAIANSKKENGDWNWRTFGTGDGFVADLLMAGVIWLADTLQIKNADGTVKLTSTGFEMTETDVARAMVKAGQIAMQVWDSATSSWVNGLYFDTAKKKFVFNGELSAELITALEAEFDVTISNTVIVNNLYAQYGRVADLTVSSINTDNVRIKRYLASSTAEIPYWEGYEQYIKFHIATTDGLTTEQLEDKDGNPLWWDKNIALATLNAKGWPEIDGVELVTTATNTGWPVTVYHYTEPVKGELGFYDNAGTKIMRIKLGAGTGVGDNDTLLIYKLEDKAVIKYITDDGTECPIELTDFVDAKHRRVTSCNINRGTGAISLLMEGQTTPSSISFVEGADGVTYTFPDGFTTTISIIS